MASVLLDPSRGRFVALAVLALLAWIALVLRVGLDTGGVLDIDVINFGLAATRMSVLDHQPQPPGYPGYVVLLKLVHLLGLGADPISVAKWTTRVAGTLTVFAAYWACSEVLGGRPDARGRALSAAAFAVVHPVLWFYGGDGQSHGAEGLATLALVAAVARVRRTPSRPGILIVVALFALAGSIRPSIPICASPLLVWLLWRRPASDWLLAAVVGVAVSIAWYVPLVIHAGGFDLYHRATRALVGEFFVANYSVFGERATLRGIATNGAALAWALAFSIPPLLASGARVFDAPWTRAAACVIGANIVFYALLFTVEVGYLIEVAALSVLVPATWCAAASHLQRARIVLAALLGPVIVFAAPGSAPLPFAVDLPLPTYARAVAAAGEQDVYREIMCGAVEDEPTLFVTDSHVITNSRWLPLVCPPAIVLVVIYKHPLHRALDNWLVFFADRTDAVPPPVPLEVGEPAIYIAPPVSRVVVAIDASPELGAIVAAAASCPAAIFAPYGEGSEIRAWPARCFDEIVLGSHTLVVRALGEPEFGAGFRVETPSAPRMR